jgi:UDP-3-O-[3-hydroxymyristoyl] glucosamine N-acyltransferase
VGAAIGACCVIGAGAVLGRKVQVHPLVAIGAGVQVGDDTILYPHVTLYDGVCIGARVVIHAGTVVGSSGFGYVPEGEHLVAMPHVGTVIVEDEVEIGAGVTIDRATLGATVIGQGTKVDNLVQIAHNVHIGRNCLLAGQVGISGSVVMGDGVILGGQAGVADHLTMGDGAAGGARAAVMQSVPAGAVVYGMPAHPRAEQLRIDAATRRLPELLRTLRRLERRVAELEGKGEEREPRVES